MWYFLEAKPIKIVDILNTRILATCTCTTCSLSLLYPFFHVRDLNALDILPEPEQININAEPANQTAPDDPHLNIFIKKVRKLVTSIHNLFLQLFTEFEKLMNTYEFDIMTLSKTWLKDDVNLLNHVIIPGYKPEYNHHVTRSGHVGMYIWTELKHKLRKDGTRLEPDIEHLWIEEKVGIKITPT